MHFSYAGIVCDCSREKFDEAVRELSAMSAQERKHFMKSVAKTLSVFVKRGAKMNARERADCGADIALFFANEAVEKRLENYKSVIQ